LFPEFRKDSEELWAGIQKEFSEARKAPFNERNEHMLFNFLCRSIVNRDPSNTELQNDGPSCVKKWLALQLAPIASSGVLPKIVEEITIHAAPLPPCLVHNNYRRLRDFFSATEVLDKAERFGVNREEACDNLLFMVCFNAFGGLMILFPNIIRRIVQVGGQLQRNLAEEVRGAVRVNNCLDAQALSRMALLRSTVYEVLRLDPPVPFQYAKAKEDFVLESHDARYQVRKGELLAGYQPMAMRDPLVFEDAQQFTPDRFMHEDADKGQKLLQYLFWSNGPQTDEPSVHNKQCAGKNIVVTLACLFVAHIYLRYDSVDIDHDTSSSAIVFTALNGATF